jgi:hypothetical protein
MLAMSESVFASGPSRVLRLHLGGDTPAALLLPPVALYAPWPRIECGALWAAAPSLRACVVVCVVRRRVPCVVVAGARGPPVAGTDIAVTARGVVVLSPALCEECVVDVYRCDTAAADGDGAGEGSGAYVLETMSADLAAYLHGAGVALALASAPGDPRVDASNAVRVASGDAPPQAPGALVMVAPAAFGFNAPASADNAFMEDPGAGGGASATTDAEVAAAAAAEFGALYAALVHGAGARVALFGASASHGTPDAVFVNNWFSTHGGGGAEPPRLVLYPMRHACVHAPHECRVRTRTLTPCARAGPAARSAARTSSRRCARRSARRTCSQT